MLFVMQCLNEEFAVDRCIGDFHDEPFVDKIIVIDGGSTDYTVQELKKFSKVSVFVHPWLDWYHDMNICQRNVGLSYVPVGKTFFMLDFDERLSDDLKQFLRDFKGTDFDLLNVPRMTFELIRFPYSPFAMFSDNGWPLISHQIGQFPDYQPRIIKRRLGMTWVNSPHHCLFGKENEDFLPNEFYITHYEKDDARCRLRIERKWAREQAVRKQLGLHADVFETNLKPEVAQYGDPEAWK